MQPVEDIIQCGMWNLGDEGVHWGRGQFCVSGHLWNCMHIWYMLTSEPTPYSYVLVWHDVISGPDTHVGLFCHFLTGCPLLPEEVCMERAVSRVLETLRGFPEQQMLRVRPQRFPEGAGGRLEPWELCLPELCVAIQVHDTLYTTFHISQ